jgi:hypothetical protein
MKRTLFPAILFLLIILVYFPPREIALSDSKILNWSFLGVVFLGIPYSIYRTIMAFNSKGIIALSSAIGSVLIIGPSSAYFREYNSIQELTKNGKWTVGTISEYYLQDRLKSRNRGCRMRASFTVENKTYKTALDYDKEEKYGLKDTISILYLPEDPRLNRTIKKMKN